MIRPWFHNNGPPQSVSFRACMAIWSFSRLPILSLIVPDRIRESFSTQMKNFNDYRIKRHLGWAFYLYSSNYDECVLILFSMAN